ncbi:MAG: antibiotic biosynthesis monooxygenase [Pseudomonas putida]
MQHSSHVLELAIFKVKQECVAQIPALRAGLRETLKSFPGLLEYHAYCPMSDDRVFADLAMWDSLENAQHVAKAFNDGDPRFSEYMHAIEQLTFMSHLAPEMK